jgi:hypothetical protein
LDSSPDASSDLSEVLTVEVFQAEIDAARSRDLNDRDRLLHWQPTIAADPPIDLGRIELEFVR